MVASENDFQEDAGAAKVREQGKRMTWISSGRVAKALMVSIAVGLGMTACTRDYTVAYVYATSATRTTTGAINAYSVDYNSGALQQLADSPIPSGGSNPVTLVASPNAQQIYVVNQNTSTVVQFNVGSDGKLYAENTYNVVQGGNGTTGSLPIAAAIDPAGQFLYVTFLYQNGFTTARPGPGGLATFPINSDGTLGTPLTNTTIGVGSGGSLPYIPLGNNPVGVVASADNGHVYVVEQDTTVTNGVSAPTGSVVAFSKSATGALTLIPGNITIPGTITGQVLTGYKAGTKPSALAEDPNSHFLYVTDQATNLLYAFSVVTGGALSSIPSSPYSTGQFPLGLTIDPRGEFIYVANFSDNTVSIFTINEANGSLSGVAALGGGTTSTGPTCVTIEPALGIYLYTSNNLDPTVTAAQLNPHTGALTQIQGTPYVAQPLPTCVVSIANGSHAHQIVQ